MDTKAEDIITESTPLRRSIMKDLIEPLYYGDVSELISEKKNFRRIGCCCETMSKVLVGISGVMSFAAGFYDEYKIFAFVAGAVNTAALVAIHFANYSDKESKQRNDQLNTLLERLRIETVPNIITQSEQI